ncbi:MAG: SUMF1/EgtB/PvdO family nonheme iron enzyme [Magnetococcales bacterium]|nr:SUMF1/EgtB/PvdO family nonheme iron enzyme [Magnetococcales bacterium]NGZ28785.1 SUMF1/EgtB/PvdO family nonheme iron enzyme [Magnetococcales bacterium]
MTQGQTYDTLPPGTMLLWYEIERVLGKGGFGVTYLGQDTNLDQPVAIKEYLPVGFAARGEGYAVLPVSPSAKETYEWGLERFLKEAQILARFRHPSIVRVLSFFRHANTAYMVMEYEEGESLEALLRRKKVLSEAEINVILPPMLSAMEALHKAEYIHRDIKPANIFIRRDGSPVLLDFGSARQAVAGQAHQMTSLLSLGYSPFEQYDASNARQGPWSDIYSMGGVLYRAVVGEKPVDAAVRIGARLRNEPDPMKSAYELRKGRYSEGFLKAIDKALMVMDTDRPQSIAAWRPMITGQGGGEEPPVVRSAPQPPPPSPPPEPSYREEDKTPVVEERASQTGLLGMAKQNSQPKKSTWRSFIASINDRGGAAKPAVQEKENTGLGRLVIQENTPSLEAVIAPPPAPFKDRAPGTPWTEPLTQVEFVWIPPGKFTMGSPRDESSRKPDEGPQHEVELDGFWMGKYPITWTQWKRVMGDPRGLYQHERGDFPVERVLWEDTQNFLRKFLRMVGGNVRARLPTEAEWEYAARAGTPYTYFFGDDPALLKDYAWYSLNSGGSTQPVGLKKPNPWGLHDILGNVWEWTEDWYSEDYYQNSPQRNPRGAPFGDVRVRRGGSWRSHANACRIAHRNRVAVQANSSALGFRLVKLEDS